MCDIYVQLQWYSVHQKREDEYQQEMEQQRIEKEKEIARLRAQQERAKDKQAEKVTIICMYIYFVTLCQGFFYTQVH